MNRINTMVLTALAWAIAHAGAARGEDEDKPLTLKVPGWARGQGYALRIDDEVIELEGDRITVQPTSSRRRVELVDHRRRILSEERLYVDQSLLDDLSDRDWRFGILLGNTRANGDAFRDVLQDGSFSEASAEVMWQPGALGLALSFARLDSEDEHSQGVKSTYDAAQTRVAAAYELAPFGRSARGHARRLHLIGLLGAQHTRHSLEIADAVVKLRAKDDTVGPFAALDLAFPINSFWIHGRCHVSYQEIEFATFRFKTKSVQQGCLIGGSYAF